MAEKEKLNPVDLVRIGNLLEYLVAADNITCEERDSNWTPPTDHNIFYMP